MKKESILKKLDWVTTVIPLVCVLALCIVFYIWPTQSDSILWSIRGFFGDTCGLYYSVLGLGFVVVTVWIAFSKYGKIRLGNVDKPQYSTVKWCMMMFTASWTADIIFYSLCEWAMYMNEAQMELMGGKQEWVPVYPLFHWGMTGWAFYVILVIPFAFMLHTRGRDRQKFSEGCRPILGDKVDGPVGRVIDLLAVISLLAGTATTFSVTSPLLSAAMSRLFGLPNTAGLTISIILFIAMVYTLAVWFGMKGVSRLATFCSYLFIALIMYVLLFGGEARYLLETMFSSTGTLFQNFLVLSTWMDPLRETNFPQNWTIYYWAYCMAWSVSMPFFIALISKGRTIKNVVLGTYIVGFLGTLASFGTLGNYGLAQELKHGLDVSGFLAGGGDLMEAVMMVFDSLPYSKIALVLLVVTMMAFFSTTFDALTMVVSAYSYKRLPPDQEPDRRVRTFWCLVLIMFPIVLIFLQNSLYSLQSFSIIAAFPIGILSIIMIIGFFKDANAYLKERAS